MKTILVDAVYSFVNGEGAIDKKLLDLLEAMNNPKIIVTNATEDKYETYGLNSVPYEVFTLRHNPNKTDPEYFRRLLEHYNLTANDVIYFEHDVEAIRSAESVGITSYFYDDSRKDLDGLKAFLLSSLQQGLKACSAAILNGLHGLQIYEEKLNQSKNY